MSLKKAPLVPAVCWEILKVDSKKIIGLSFAHNEFSSVEVFHALTLKQTKQLILDLQMHVDYFNRFSK